MLLRTHIAVLAHTVTAERPLLSAVYKVNNYTQEYIRPLFLLTDTGKAFPRINLNITLPLCVLWYVNELPAGPSGNSPDSSGGPKAKNSTKFSWQSFCIFFFYSFLEFFLSTSFLYPLWELFSLYVCNYSSGFSSSIG